MIERDIQPLPADRPGGVYPVPTEAVPEVVQPAVSPFQRLHRHLRGRYLWAAILALVGMSAGAYLGWKSQDPLYAGQGIIYISPSMPSPQDPAGNNVLPMFKGFVAFQVRVLESLNATHLAMETDTWQKTGEGMDPEAIASFIERRSILHEADTQHVMIQFLDPSPDVAVAGVRALIEAYEKLSAEENARDDRLQFATTNAQVLTAQLKDGADQILKLTSDYGGVEGLEMRHRDAVTQVLALEQDLDKLQATIRAREANTTAAGGPLSPKTAGEIAIESPQMAEALLQLDILIAQEQLLAQTVGERNDRLVSLRQEIGVRKKRISQFSEDWNRGRMTPKGTEASLDELKAREAALVQHLTALREESRKFGKTRVEVGKLKAENEDLARRLDQMKGLKDQLSAQLVGKGRITIADPGRRPSTPFRDRRKVMGAMGGIAGAGLGVLIVLLFGLRDRRFRNTDDVGTSLATLKLLGLMPALPSDLSEPRSGEIAAHCVHQIRTLLQIGHARGQGSCICVTGPSVGSGKTTLSLALGLSFSSSGSRTLIVDADLTGRGLTRRVSRMLLSHTRRVSAPALPAGSAQGERQLLEPLVHPRSGADQPQPQEIVDLLTRAVEGMGLEEAHRSGVVADLFALADLLYRGEVRADLASRMAAVLSAAAPQGTDLATVPAHVLELDATHPEFNGDPIERYLFPTGVATLRFLPLRGLGGKGEVSVATISKILDRLRGEFDVAIVDTGPAPGAVETPMVASHADGTVLVVSPSDQRPDAERTVALMGDVGARMAGVVFNRAGTKDVMRSSRSHSVPDGVNIQ